MLIERYKSIFRTDETWKYYSQLHFHDNPFENEGIADNFISEYFKNGNKQNVLDNKFPKDRNRDIHSISTFFLGILFKPLCKIPELKPDFRYLWFITCLYHDYGYHIEKEKRIYCPEKLSLKSLCKKLRIKNNLLELNFYSNERLETISNYYNFCRQELHFVNHGIIGGLLLYDRLKRNYFEQRENALKAGISVENDDFNYNGLHWSLDHDEFYRKAADSIIFHNIWYAYEPNDILLYNSYHLKNLIIQNQNEKISLNSDPFFFLLLLADTIEPIKSFDQISYKCILEKIDIELIGENKILINVFDNCLNFKNWYLKILDLENWLDLKISNNEENKLQIEIK